MSKEEDLQAWREGLERRAQIFKNTFNTDAGRLCLIQLKEAFLKQSLMGATPEKTAYKVGQHDLAQFIVDMVELKDG